MLLETALFYTSKSRSTLFEVHEICVPCGMRIGTWQVLRREQPSVPACGAGTASATSRHVDDGKNDDDAPTPAPSTSISDDDAFLTAHSDCYSLCAYPGVQMSDFPVWWMAVPFFLVGLGECLCNIPLYELCYSQTPPAYRSMAQV